MQLYIILKYWQAIIIGLLAFLLLITLMLLNVKTGKLKEAETKCQQRIQAIEQAQYKALNEANAKANQASADYEQLKSERQAKAESITRTVQKIVERPIYFNSCFDSDGMHELNSLIKAGHSSESKTTLSGSQ
ncbi:hypothetical protein [Acinetobacter soli]|uniref:DUF2570 domain-containing protein n=1 Tax=Acinetobacter soli TaxID=487316 RepID=A0A1P8EMU5_9GAMM|nr:hypothetical protein [Acinetobacter soli]APV37489.1 hypothetical protein BEN76_03160 [Acinetobacter soli]